MTRFLSRPSAKVPKHIHGEPVKRFCGFEIDRKTNVLSLVAFILSATGIASQVYFFIQGPKIALQPPEQVVFYGLTSADGKTKYLKIASRMSYVNTGQPGFNDAIKRETAHLQIGKKTYSFFWKKYVATDSEGTKFLVNPKGDALPVAVNAGSVESHETSFSPIPTPGSKTGYGVNYLEFDDFVKHALAEKELLVTLHFETFAGASGDASCRILVDASFRYYIKNGWIGPICLPK